MKLSLIVAMTRDGLIGKGGGLPWGRIPEDMRHFRALTKGNVVVMGRKTWSSIGFLPLRYNLVLTRSTSRRSLAYHGYCSVDQLLDAAEELAECPLAADDPDQGLSVYVIGGTQAYAAFEPHVSTAHVTVIDGEFEGDAYFPFALFDTPEWEPVADPVTLAPGVAYHRLGRVARS